MTYAQASKARPWPAGSADGREAAPPQGRARRRDARRKAACATRGGGGGGARRERRRGGGGDTAGRVTQATPSAPHLSCASEVALERSAGPAALCAAPSPEGRCGVQGALLAADGGSFPLPACPASSPMPASLPWPASIAAAAAQQTSPLLAAECRLQNTVAVRGSPFSRPPRSFLRGATRGEQRGGSGMGGAAEEAAHQSGRPAREEGRPATARDRRAHGGSIAPAMAPGGAERRARPGGLAGLPRAPAGGRARAAACRLLAVLVLVAQLRGSSTWFHRYAGRP